MKVWVDPKETAAGAWSEAAEGPERPAVPPATPVVERAHATRYPVQYTDGAFLTPATAPTADGPEASEYARIQFNCAVDGAGTIKLTARGYRWGGEDADVRFKSLFSRAPMPTETQPIETYERWRRAQRGTVSGFEAGDEYIDFVPEDGTTEESRERREWDQLRWAVQLRLAELELVRNTAFARYRLRERDEWDAVRGTVRWKPTAFGDADGGA